MEMINIILACSAGMSTSILVEKMFLEAEAKGIETNIVALSSTEVDDYLEDNAVDVVLLGPQVKYLKARLREGFGEAVFPIGTIDARDYGTMNGTNVLNQALDLLNIK